MASFRFRSKHSSTVSARLAVIVAAIIQILVPALPSVGIGSNIGDQSDSVNTLITPAGWAFSIWGPLYLGSLAFAIYQASATQTKSPLLSLIRWPAAGAFLGNALWAAYVQSVGVAGLSVAIIVCTLICLLLMYRQFAEWRPGFTRGEQWCAVLPLSALASWLTVATIVNFAASLRYHGVDAGSYAPLIGAAIIVIGGSIGATALSKSYGNPFYAAVLLWALAAIFAQGGQVATAIAAACVVSALLVIIATLVGLRGSGFDHWFRKRDN